MEDGRDDEVRVQLVVLHQEALLALCRSILGHAEDAEDAAQEVFLRAFRALPRFREESAFRTWLFRIAINLCRKWKRRHREAELWDEAHPGPLPVGSLSPESDAIRRLQLMEALNALPLHYRAILLLKEFVNIGAENAVVDYTAIAWQIGIHVTFLFSGLIFAIMDYWGARRLKVLAELHEGDAHGPELEAYDPAAL